MTAHGSLHLARKAEQVPQGLRDLGSLKRTCPLCSVKTNFAKIYMDFAISEKTGKNMVKCKYIKDRSVKKGGRER